MAPPAESGLSARCKYIRITMTTSLCSAWPISTGRVLSRRAGDNGFYTERLTAPDTLELIYVEAGHAAVYRAHLLPRSSLGRASPPEEIAATTWHFGVYRQ